LVSKIHVIFLLFILLHQHTLKRHASFMKQAITYQTTIHQTPYMKTNNNPFQITYVQTIQKSHSQKWTSYPKLHQYFNKWYEIRDWTSKVNGVSCWNIANYVAAIVKEDGCHVRVKEGCWCNICSPLTLSKKEATMVGCWWQPTSIV